MPDIINEFDVLSELKEEIKSEIKLFYIFPNVRMKSNMKDMELKGFNVFIVNKEEKVFGFGLNSMNLLSFDHNEPIKYPTIVPELCDKQITNFANGISHCIGRSLDGKVYRWGRNELGQLGLEVMDDFFYNPRLISALRDKNVAQICCGSYHTLCLTKSGELYAFGSNRWGQLGINSKKSHSKAYKLHGFNGEKVMSISCGSWHSIAITESGRVLSWGLNRFGQLGNGNTDDRRKPQVIKVIDNDAKIVAFNKISCGSEHSLLLSRSGDIYAFGRNDFGQLGSSSEKEIIPLKINCENKFTDIESHHFFDISAALSANGHYHIWGKCGEEVIKKPKDTKIGSFIDIFKYFHRFTYEVIDPFKYDSIPRRDNGKMEREFTDEKLISGDGSFGIVFKALSKTDSETYAIKKLALSQNEFELVFRELEIMKSLSNHVVKYEHTWIEMNYYQIEPYKSKIIYKIYSNHRVFDPQKPFLLHIQMELCSKTLREFIDDLIDNENITALFYYTACHIFLYIVESVNFLHKHKPQIIHRDLNPDNIFIMEEFKGKLIKLADFGLAVKHEFKSQSHTEDRGTVKYMAPEVIYRRKYNIKADIFSLGVIFEELFGFGTRVICDGDIELLAEKYSGLEILKDKMLALEKNLRPSCDEIIEEVHKLSLTLTTLENNIEFKQLNTRNSDVSFLFKLSIIYRTQQTLCETNLNDENKMTLICEDC